MLDDLWKNQFNLTMLSINNNTLHKSPNFKGLNIGPKASKALDKIGALKSPGQRLAFGVAALTLHPVMDRLNPWIDDETKETSAIRSAAKAIACTLTGVIIREGCIIGTNAILNNENIVKKLPKYMTKDKGHTSAVIGTLMGLGIMMFTNFLIDVPLTDKLTHIFTEHAKKKGKIKENEINNKSPKPSFDPDLKEKLQQISNKIQTGELPPMSQVNMEVLKWDA